MTRHVRPRREVKPEPLPLDIRMMQQLNRLMVMLLSVILIAGLLWWVIRLPLFAIAGITLVGQVEHNNEVTIRANVTPQLKGDFFTFDLQKTQKIFETVPWVRKAVVQREFPNRLRVELEEHQPVAFWGEESQGRLLNKQGEVFDANWGELEDDKLPQLIGPDNQSAQVLDVYQLIEPEFKRLGLSIRALELTARGSWRAKLANASVVEMGLLAPGAVLMDEKRRHKAVVRADGALGLNQIVGSIHKMGALAQGLPACNGWTFWHYETPKGLQSIDTLRAQIRVTMKDAAE